MARRVEILYGKMQRSSVKLVPQSRISSSLRHPVLFPTLPHQEMIDWGSRTGCSAWKVGGCGSPTVLACPHLAPSLASSSYQHHILFSKLELRNRSSKCWRKCKIGASALKLNKWQSNSNIIAPKQHTRNNLRRIPEIWVVKRLCSLYTKYK